MESVLIHHAISYSAPVAQLDRVPGYEPGGREFESLRARQKFAVTPNTYLYFFRPSQVVAGLRLAHLFGSFDLVIEHVSGFIVPFVN